MTHIQLSGVSVCILPAILAIEKRNEAGGNSAFLLSRAGGLKGPNRSVSKVQCEMVARRERKESKAG